MKKNKRTQSFLFYIYIFVLLPAIVILPFSIISVIYLKGFYETSLENRYSDKLESVYKSIESSLQSISQNVRFLEMDEAFMNTVKGSPVSGNVKKSYRQLKRFVMDYPMVENACIVDRGSNTVYTAEGTVEYTEFFEKNFKYENYNAEYWKNYRNVISEKQILPPTEVTHYEQVSNVIPIVFAKIGNTYTSNLLIINISVSEIFNEIEKNSSQVEAVYEIINKHNGKRVTRDGLSENVLPTDFIENILEKNYVRFNYKLSGKNVLVFAYSPTRSILGYSYMALVPKSVINKSIYSAVIVMLLAWIILILIILIVSRYSVKKLYAPIENIINMISGNDDFNTKTAEFVSINQYIRRTMKMQKNFLPLIHESLLSDFLKQSNPNDKKIKSDLEENGLVFENPMFCVAILRIHRTAHYYKEFSGIDHDELFEKLLDSLCLCFPESYNAYGFRDNDGNLCVLFNADSTASVEVVSEVLDKFCSYLEQDKDSIRIKAAAGGFYEGFGGLKKSYDEAVPKLSGVTVSPDSEPENRHFKKKTKIVNIETTLNNYLLTGNVKLAREYVNTTVENELVNNNLIALYNLYVRIINTIVNVMIVRGLSYEGIKASEIDVTKRFFSLAVQDLSGEIENLLDVIEENIFVSKVNVDEIALYIQNNYTKDMNLNELAEMYGTSASYLSRVLKEKLGVTFVNYIGRLRVENAKELLEKTNLSVTEIGEKSGFVNRNAFTRVFKASTGVTPSEYRKIKVK